MLVNINLPSDIYNHYLFSELWDVVLKFGEWRETGYIYLIKWNYQFGITLGSADLWDNIHLINSIGKIYSQEEFLERFEKKLSSKLFNVVFGRLDKFTLKKLAEFAIHLTKWEDDIISELNIDQEEIEDLLTKDIRKFTNKIA